jgi:phosphoinositide 3-/4-kinase-like protein
VPSIERFGIDYDIKLDRPPTGDAITAAAFRFDPDQPRDRDGRWTDGPGGGVAVVDEFGEWSAQAADPGNVTGDDLLRIGARIGEIMQRDGTSMMDPLAMMRATREAVAEDDADITARQYIRAMDRDYGTNLDSAVTAALATTGEEREAADLPRVKPEPIVREPEPEPEGPTEYSPDFSASLADRRERLQQGIDSGPAEGDQLAGGDVANTFGFTWNDGSRAVLKEAKREVRGMTPREQTDAEELAGIVAEVVGVRAPAAQRISDTEIYLEYMPGETGMKRFGGSVPYRYAVSEEGLNMGLFDQLIGNNDRHTGNWTVDRDDRLYAIDHGLAFGGDVYGDTFGPFGFELLYGGHEIPYSRFEQIRRSLEGVRGEFDRLGRGRWYDSMITRLNAMQNRIGGLG